MFRYENQPSYITSEEYAISIHMREVSDIEFKKIIGTPPETKTEKDKEKLATAIAQAYANVDILGV